MSDYGFWNLAQKDPEHLALVEPDGRKVTAGELLAASNRLVHGLRALGLKQGDCIATVLPNGAAMIELYLAAAQAGLYLVPINHHLTAAEIAYIVQDSEAKAFIGAERFADACRGAAEELRFPENARFAVGRVPGFRAYAELTERPARHAAGEPRRRTGDELHLRHHRPAEGRAPAAGAVRSRRRVLDVRHVPRHVRHPAASDDNVHLYRLAALPHRRADVRRLVAALRPHRRADGQVDAGELPRRRSRSYRVTTSHMVPTQFHRLLALPEDVKRALRRLVAAPHDPRRGAVSGRREAPHARVVGAGDLRVLRRQRGRRHAGHAGGVAAAIPAPSAAPGRARRSASSTTPARTVRPAQPGTVYMALGAADFEYHKDKAKTEANRREGFFTVGDVGYLNDEGYLFLCDRKIDMIISGGVNIYPSEIESVLLTHPKVADVAVFGIPNEDWGEEVKAVIEPAPGVTAGPALAAGDPRLLRGERGASTSAPSRSTSSTRCRAIRTASCTSASCAIRTGRAASGRSEE